MRTVEDIYASMQAVMDAAEGRSLTEEECTAYEKLEAELAGANRNSQIAARHAAYSTPIAPAIHVAPAKPDNGLDKAFDAYLRTGQPNADISGLRVTNAQGEGTSTAGGYLVPPGFRQKLVEVRKAFGGLAALVDTFSTSTGNPIEYPTIDDTANQGDITAESAAISSGADMVFGSVNLGAYKYTSAGAGSNLPLRVSVELLQDSAFDIQGLVARVLGTRIARKQAVHWVTGTGVGQPFGLVNSTLTADNELDTPDTIDYDDILDTEDALDPAYEQNAAWIMRKNTWSQIRGIVDTNGRPLVQTLTEGISGQPQRSLLGYPVYLDQAMPALSSAADGNCIAFGDFREAYTIRRVHDLAIIVNPYTRAANGEVEFSAWERADGTVQNRSAYVICQNNT